MEIKLVLDSLDLWPIAWAGFFLAAGMAVAGYCVACALDEIGKRLKP